MKTNITELNSLSEKVMELILQEINNNIFNIENELNITKESLKKEILKIIDNENLIRKNIPILN